MERMDDVWVELDVLSPENQQPSLDLVLYQTSGHPATRARADKPCAWPEQNSRQCPRNSE